MKKAFFNALGEKKVSVTALTNQEGVVYRFNVQVGHFTFGLKGTEKEDKMDIAYPTNFEKLHGIPIELHDDNDLARFVLALLELSHSDEKINSFAKQINTFSSISSDISNLQEFEAQCRKMGAVTYLSMDDYASSGHNEEDYDPNSPYIVFYLDNECMVDTCQTDTVNEGDYWIPNAKNVAIRSYDIHISDVYLHVSFIILDHIHIHPEFPVLVYNTKGNIIKECHDMENVLSYTNQLFHKAQKEASSSGLSLYAYHWFQAMRVGEGPPPLTNTKKELSPRKPAERSSVFYYKQDEPPVIYEDDELPF